jgi:serine/threonine protein kinase
MATPRAPPAAVSRRPPPPPNLEQEPDEIVGEFRRGKEIGKGSFATVYLAQHRVRPLHPGASMYIEQDDTLIPSRVDTDRPSNTC